MTETQNNRQFQGGWKKGEFIHFTAFQGKGIPLFLSGAKTKSKETEQPKKSQ